MREITEHQINPVNDKLNIQVIDEPGAGGANHCYRITWPGDSGTLIEFQNGPINEVGVNGITQEALIAICVDRLRSFQAGPYACHENGQALAHLEHAQNWLLERTRARMARGVEGTQAK